MKPLMLLPAGCLLAITAALSPVFAAEPTAASAAFTSRDPVVLKVTGLVKAGKFQKAENLLRAPDSPGDAEALRARQETLEIIRRTRIEYSLDEAGLIEKVRKSIPDATAREVRSWAKASSARYRMIDGKKFYFRREPSNIFLFCDEAKQRRAQAGNAPPEANSKLAEHLKAVVEAAEKTSAVELQPVHHRLTYTVTLRANTPGVKAGSLVRAWLPYPQEYRQQRDVKLISASPEPKLIAPSAVEGNPVSGGPQRTVYFERQVTDPAKPIEFKQVFEYNCFAYYPRLDEAKVQPLPADWNGACLGERPPHIVFTPEMRKRVAGIVGNETNPLAKARKIFRWVSANVKWT